jgi:cellulase
MALRSLPVLAAFLGAVAAQSVGTMSPEVHPKLTTWECTKAGGCKSKDTALVIDALSHWVHQKENTNLGCGDWGNPPNATVCPDLETCQTNCVMEGVSDLTTYGVFANGGSVTMKLLRPDGSTASPRIYLLAEGEKEYEMLKLTGKEFTFDVDVSKLPCGMNGALYTVEMEADGGADKLNTGGATYGTGYCDAQCFVTPFINGVGNIEGKGSCCNEMDIWEANAPATQIAPHVCGKDGLYKCTGDECAFEGVCDKNGCGYNTYVNGAKNFYGAGPGFAVDTTKPFTVVTQFPADEAGNLKEIRRIYVQGGKVIPQAAVAIEGPPKINFINEEYCADTGARRYEELGSMKAMGGALSRGMVLAMSIWWDEGGNMNWLDSGNAGPCNATEGNPSVIRQVESDPTVIFSNIKWGELDSTYSGKPSNCKRRAH